MSGECCDKPATEVAGDPAVFRAFQSSLAGLVRTSQVKLAEYSVRTPVSPAALYHRRVLDDQVRYLPLSR